MPIHLFTTTQPTYLQRYHYEMKVLSNKVTQRKLSRENERGSYLADTEKLIEIGYAINLFIIGILIS